MSEYIDWMAQAFNVEISNRNQGHYESVVEKARSTFSRSKFWQTVNKQLVEFDSQFKLIDGYDLLLTIHAPDLYVKPYDSFLLKTYRKNVLLNHNWPSEPLGGWITPENWYSKINDMIRTRYVVKYLDDVQFLVNQIRNVAEECKLSSRVDFEAKAERYYAAHLYVAPTFEVPALTWDTENVDISIEIQITTQLQEVMLKLLHEHYERRRRTVAESETVKWQWDYRSEEFASNYLSHILHYVEGMIVDLRQRRAGESK